MKFPAFLSVAARSFIQLLLHRDPERRLGHGDGGGRAVRDHIFFAGVDWALLAQGRLQPPFVPAEAVGFDADDKVVTEEEAEIKR